jgi:hypothetical protein
MLTELQQQFVNIQCQHHAVNGELLSLELLKEEYGFKRTEIAKLYNSHDVKVALEERGIELDHYDVDLIDAVPTKARSKSLTPMQLVVANTLLDLHDTRSHKKKLQDLEITTQRYATWMRDPVFAKYLRERAEAMLGDNMHEAHLSLLDKVRLGDMKAIELFYDITDRYVKQPTAVGAGNQPAVDVKALLIKILDIINEEVEDRAIQAKIADRFMLMIQARTIAGELLDSEPIEVPTVAPIRVLESVKS